MAGMKHILTYKDEIGVFKKAVLQKKPPAQWVEIITARMAAHAFEFPNPEQFFADIRACVDIGKPQYEAMVIYRNSLVENDWSIHLHWRTSRQPPGKTELGIKLANIVRSMGLVDHTIWIEHNDKTDTKE
jgi:hypothetical protein